MPKYSFKEVLFLAGAMFCVLTGAQAHAAMQTVTAHIAFDTPLSLVKTSDIDFGSVQAVTADTYTISTSGVVTAAGTGTSLSGPTSAGNITVSGSTTQSVGISVGDYTSQNGVSLQNAVCSYDGSAPGSCTVASAPAAGGGKTLLVGVDAVVDGTQVAGAAAAPSFTVTIVYQ